MNNIYLQKGNAAGQTTHDGEDCRAACRKQQQHASHNKQRRERHGLKMFPGLEPARDCFSAGFINPTWSPVTLEVGTKSSGGKTPPGSIVSAYRTSRDTN